MVACPWVVQNRSFVEYVQKEGELGRNDGVSENPRGSLVGTRWGSQYCYTRGTVPSTVCSELLLKPDSEGQASRDACWVVKLYYLSVLIQFGIDLGEVSAVGDGEGWFLTSFVIPVITNTSRARAFNNDTRKPTTQE